MRLDRNMVEVLVGSKCCEIQRIMMGTWKELQIVSVVIILERLLVKASSHLRLLHMSSREVSGGVQVRYGYYLAEETLLRRRNFRPEHIQI